MSDFLFGLICGLVGVAALGIVLLRFGVRSGMLHSSQNCDGALGEKAVWRIHDAHERYCKVCKPGPA